MVIGVSRSVRCINEFKFKTLLFLFLIMMLAMTMMMTTMMTMMTLALLQSEVCDSNICCLFIYRV